MRTISKALLAEFVQYFKDYPYASSKDARNALSGCSDIDKYEYGYNSTLTVMAKMVIKHEKKREPISYLKNTLTILQQIFYGAPGTGKSHCIKEQTEGKQVIRTTFHPDSDYSTFVGAYKPTSVEVPVMTIIGKEQVPVMNAKPERKIVYEFVPQAFLKAYTEAWKNQNVDY